MVTLRVLSSLTKVSQRLNLRITSLSTIVFSFQHFPFKFSFNLAPVAAKSKPLLRVWAFWTHNLLAKTLVKFKKLAISMQETILNQSAWTLITTSKPTLLIYSQAVSSQYHFQTSIQSISRSKVTSVHAQMLISSTKSWQRLLFSKSQMRPYFWDQLVIHFPMCRWI